MRRIAVLAASGRELTPARSVISASRSGRLGSVRYEVGRAGCIEVYLVDTGMGPVSAFASTEAILAEPQLDAVVSTGYAGGLGPAGPGEVILATELLDWTGEQSRIAIPADAELLRSARAAAQEAGVVWTEGPVVTMRKVVCSSLEKKALGKASGAIAVDMESAAIAKAAAHAGVPFLLVRVVSDSAEEDLPMDFNLWLSPWGRLCGMGQLLLRPSLLRSLFRMRRQVEQGSQSLARFFHAWMPSLGLGRPSLHRDGQVTVGVV